MLQNIPNKLKALHESSKAVLDISAYWPHAVLTLIIIFGSPIKYEIFSQF